MEAKKRLGIWMDHATAHLIELSTERRGSNTINSKFTYEERATALDKSEHLMHNKEQAEQLSYYRKLGEAIRNYSSVLLFGPTTAKIELLNLLRADHHFQGVKIETRNADKMTNNQQQAFVKDYFDSN